MHQSLIVGHIYTYRVRASNFMGFGAPSLSFSYTPRSVPGQPPTPPRNVLAQTTRNVLFVQYDFVINDGGSAILNYNIYIDDGMGGNFTGPILNGNSVNIWSSQGLSLVTGR